MAEETQSETLLVIDARLFTSVAIALAPSFKKTYYSEVRCSAFPSSQDAMAGDGLPHVERAYSPWRANDGRRPIEVASIAVFPDVTTGSLVDFVEDYGIPVFGSRHDVAELELDRWAFRKVLKEVGLPVGRATRVTGVEDLKKLLQKTEEVFIKYGRFRADMETREHVSWEYTEAWYDDLVSRLGPRKETAEFIVEDKIDGIECGFDTYSVDGEYPYIVEYSYEQKGNGHVGQIVEYDKLPGPLTTVIEAMSPVLKKYRHRGWFSGECRATKDGTVYFIDPCMRCANPPTFSLLKAYDNWPEIVSQGARGKLVDPRPNCRFLAESMLSSEFVKTHFLPVSGDPKRVTFERETRLGDRIYIIPDKDDAGIGSAIGLGDTMEAAVAECRKTAKEVKGDGVQWDDTAFDKLDKVIEKGKEYGVDW